MSEIINYRRVVPVDCWPAEQVEPVKSLPRNGNYSQLGMVRAETALRIQSTSFVRDEKAMNSIQVLFENLLDLGIEKEIKSKAYRPESLESFPIIIPVEESVVEKPVVVEATRFMQKLQPVRVKSPVLRIQKKNRLVAAIAS